MKNLNQNKSAYGGKGFLKRKSSNTKTHFKNEYKKLNEVLMFVPGDELEKIKDPNKVQHLVKINIKKLQKEMNEIILFFKKNKIEVSLIKNKNAPENLMFCRDIFWKSPHGIIISRMASKIREPEEQLASRHLINKENIYYHFKDGEIFEGADLLWLDSTTLLIGIGNRTNRQAYQILSNLLPNIKIIQVNLPKKVQHLLGMINFIDKNKVLIRNEIAPKKLMNLLKNKKFKIISIPESNETVTKQGMNVVVIKPNNIIMPDDCPDLERIYLKNKIKIAKKFKISEARKAAGGLACMIGILERKS